MGFISTALSVFRGGIKQVSATMIPQWWTTPSYNPTNFRANYEHRYRRNELIYACIEKTVKSVSQIDMKVKNARTNVWQTQHPLELLFNRPNLFMSEYDLWETVLTLQLLAGRAVLEKERNNAGQVIGLWPLRPDWLTPVASPTTMITGFNYGEPGSEKKAFIPYKDVIDLPLSDPISPILPFQPIAPASIAARVSDTDSQITDFVKLFFEKGGVPPGLLKTKQKLLESQVTILRRRWRERYGGIQNWLEPAVLDSDAEYQRIAMTFEEMGFEFLDRRNEARICMIFDIPPIIVGAFVGVEHSTYDNYLTARKAWWQDSLLPRFIQIRERLRIHLVPEFGNDIDIEWDLSGVHALQDDIDLKYRRAKDALTGGGITVNEYRLEIGKSPVPAGNIFLRPLNYLEVPLKGGGQTVDDLARNDTEDDEAPQIEDEGEKFLLPASLKKDAPPDRALRNKLEARMQKAVQLGFSETLSLIKEELSNGS